MLRRRVGRCRSRLRCRHPIPRSVLLLRGWLGRPSSGWFVPRSYRLRAELSHPREHRPRARVRRTCWPASPGGEQPTYPGMRGLCPVGLGVRGLCPGGLGVRGPCPGDVGVRECRPVRWVVGLGGGGVVGWPRWGGLRGLCRW